MLLPLAAVMRHRRASSDPDTEIPRADDPTAAFAWIWDGLAEDAQAIAGLVSLFDPSGIGRAELEGLAAATGRRPEAVSDAVERCTKLQVLRGDATLVMPRPFAELAKTRGARCVTRAVRDAYVDRWTRAAEALCDEPFAPSRLAALGSYSKDAEWTAATLDEGRKARVGLACALARACLAVGRFATAQTWSAAAVEWADAYLQQSQELEPSEPDA